MNLNTENLSLAVLTAIRNDLAGTPNAGKFKVSKEKALEAVKRLAKEKGISLSKSYDESGQRVAATAATLAKPAKPAKPAKKAKAVKPEKIVKDKTSVIRLAAEDLLMQVAGKDEDGRPQGHSYAIVLDAVLAKFPEANTSVACLRWYAVRMRERGLKVPNRPRAAPTATA